jgi:outer membrane protein assembly factor BamB
VVYAVDAVTGDIRWRTAVGGIFTGSSVAVDGDRIVLGVADTLLGLDRESGQVRWRYPEIGYERVAADGMVYTAGFGARVAALRGSDGVETWRATLSHPIDELVLLGDSVYANAGGRLTALHRATGGSEALTPDLGPIARLARADATLLFTVPGSEGARVTVELDPVTGRLDTIPMELLSVQANAIIFVHGEEIIAIDRGSRRALWASAAIPSATLGGGVFREGMMYQPILTGDIRGIRALAIADGSERWQFHADDLVSIPALDDRTLFLTSDDCRLYAFRLP